MLHLASGSQNEPQRALWRDTDKQVKSGHWKSVFWIGGSPCSGKSSLAKRIAAKVGSGLYHLDEHYEQHLDQADEQSSPRLVQAGNIGWDELWSQPVESLVDNELAFYEQEFPMILEDLDKLKQAPVLLAEGTGLLPNLVAHLMPTINHGAWLVPTPEFQLREYSRRPWIQDILKQCRNPRQAFENWMRRDMEFAKLIAEQAKTLGLLVQKVDGRIPLEKIEDQIIRHFRQSGFGQLPPEV